MRGWIFIALCCFNTLFAQGIVQSGGQMVVTDGAYVVIDQATGHYTATADALITLSPNARLRVTGDWRNLSNTRIFTTNNGRVEFMGAVQNIGGTQLTSFPDVAFIGAGPKHLTYNILVGGGHNHGGNGLLRLNTNTLELHGNTLIINNKSPNALMYSGTGGIISETTASAGYSRVQWNIRDGVAGPVFGLPFITSGGLKVPFKFTCNTLGMETASDSAYVRVATYPTTDIPVPNNRPMPTGVYNTENECQGENSQRLVDRFWILEDDGFTTKPDLTLSFTYADPEINASNNTIKEGGIGAIHWNPTFSRWNYPVNGTVNTAANEVIYRTGSNYIGNWAISDTTPYPRAAFSVAGKCESDSIAFTDLSGVTLDKIAQWQWNFGNSTLSGSQNPVAYYSPSGLYNVRLIIRSQSGCQDTAYKNIQILPKPTATMLISDTCENALVKFESQSWPGAGFIKGEFWDVDLGGPLISGKTATAYYGAVGIPSIKLIVYNSNGCKDTAFRTLFIAPKPYAFMTFKNDCQYSPISFTNGSTAGGGTINGYQWNFGNNRMSSNKNETMSYSTFGTFNVSMAVTNSFGCSDTMNQPIVIFPRAIAKFDYSPTEPTMVDLITFNNQSQYDSSWYWDFGDSYFDNNQNPQHAYDMYGKYTVTLVANTPKGCADTTALSITAKSKPLYWFPNVFSPGSSAGTNDEFGLVTPSALQTAISNYDLIIYNTWGQIVFRSNNPKEFWNGYYGEDLCPLGTYVYRCTFNTPENEFLAYHGHVTIIR